MNGWEVITKRLEAAGGGPLPRSAFDCDFADNNSSIYAARSAVRVGTVEMIGTRSAAMWALTPLGRDWCAGRATVRYKKSNTMAESPEGRDARHGRLVIDSDEAAKVCFALTDRQRNVLVLVCKGFTMLETSERLGIRFGAASSHMARAMRVIGCNRHIEAAVLAAKAGLV